MLAVLFWAKAVFAADGDLPRTLDELNHWYAEPPAGSNAATKFLEGTAALKITDADKASTSLPLIGKGELPQADKPVPLEMKTAMADFIQRNQSAIRLFEQAAQLQQSRYPIDLSQGLMPLLPHLAKLHDAARVLEISAISHATAGQGKEAGNDLLVSIALARSLDSEPVLMSQLVRIALVKMTVSDLEQVLNRIVLPPQSLVQLDKSFGRSEQQEAAGFGFTRALIRERIVDLRAFEMRPDQYLKISTTATVERREQLEAKIKRMMAEDRQYCKMTFNRALVLRNDPFPRRMVEEDELFSHAEAVATNKNFFLSAFF